VVVTDFNEFLVVSIPKDSSRLADDQIARLMELNPKYVGVILRQWQDWTKNRAKLESTEKPFSTNQPA